LKHRVIAEYDAKVDIVTSTSSGESKFSNMEQKPLMTVMSFNVSTIMV
jgi:hypothetical protein